MRFIKNDKVLFRHPMVPADGYGKVICKGVGKLTGAERDAIDGDLSFLFETKPGKRGDVKGRTLHPKTAEWWFAPIEAAARELELADKAKRSGFPIAPRDGETLKDALQARHESTLSESEQLKIERWKREDAEKRAKQAEKANAELQKTVTNMGQKLGASELKREGITLRECLAHFEKNVDCKNKVAKQALLTRVKDILNAIGMNTPHGAVTRRSIEDAVLATGNKRARRYSIKRFFNLLSAPVSSDGLGLSNPAMLFKIGTGTDPQRERRDAGLITTLDPAELLGNDRLPLYWKALIAVLGYAGLRLKEAAALEWDRLNVEGVMKVRPTDLYPKLKSHMSNRDIAPFPNLFDVMKEYKKIARHKTLVFDHQGESGPTWFRDYLGVPEVADLSGALTDAIGAATGMKYTLKDGTALDVKSLSRRDVDGVDTLFLKLMNDVRVTVPRAGVKWDRPKEPALRLRRFWETTMKIHGLGDLIDASGGHSKKEVGDPHYTKWESVVRAAVKRVPRLPDIETKVPNGVVRKRAKQCKEAKH